MPLSTRAATDPPPARCRFARFELRPDERRLLAEGVEVPLGARAFDVLVALTEQPGRLIAKNELLDRVWQGLVVEENNLQVQVSVLRKVLGTTALATIPGRGYRFNLPVTRLDAGAAVDAAAARAPPPPAGGSVPATPTNLRTRLPQLYGRGPDIAAAQALLRDRAMVTIAGAGGIGKTRVAQAVAMGLLDDATLRYPDGIWWVDLAPLTDAALIASSVAQAMGLSLGNDRSPSEALATLVEAKAMLLVLDNCEHLADAVAAFVEELAAGAPHVHILATSQESLKAGDEHVYRLGPLAVPQPGMADIGHVGAVELFVARARAADPRFALTATNSEAVSEICRRLDGIPLAIELAAARIPLLGIEGLRSRLHERFNLLTGGARVVLRRHQTLRATLEWSHALLTPDEQAIFRRVGVFAGGFTLEAAQRVASDARIDAWTSLDHLGALVDKSLVLAEGDPVPRYRLLETTRAYALERLAEAGETQATLRRHAEALVDFLLPIEAMGQQWPTTAANMAAVSAELDNLRAALEWAGVSPAGHDLVVRLAGVSFRVWFAVVRLAEGLDRCLALRHHLDAAVPTEDAARFWFTMARLGQYALRPEGLDAAQRAAALYRELGDERRLCMSLVNAAVQGSRFGTVEGMGAAIEEASALMRPDWLPRERAALEFARVRWYQAQNRLEDALASAQRQVAVAAEEGPNPGMHYAMSNVTSIEVALGRLDEAIAHAREAIAQLHASGHDAGAGHLYLVAGMAWAHKGCVDEALAALRNAYPRLLQEGDHYRVIAPLAVLCAIQGRFSDAARMLAFEAASRSRLRYVRQAQGQSLLLQAEDILAGHLTSEQRAALNAEGAAMASPDVFRMGFGDAL